MTARPIVLASASPRRRELLREAGVPFEIVPADVDETLAEFAAPEQAALELATRKAWAVARACTVPSLVIGADTIVAVQAGGTGDWRLLGKPADEREAAAMLGWLSGSRHQVLTAVCVARAPELSFERAFERTWVTMRAISAAERAAYVASDEWRGKAGGYAIQENADKFVTTLEEGGFDNVVGLPVALTLKLLRAAASAR